MSKVSLKPLFAIAATALLVISLPCTAGLPESSKVPIRDAMRTGGKVLVIFQTDKKATAVAAIIASAMRVTDPNAILNKQWVTNIEHRSADDDSGCGIIIGKWWSAKAGSMASDWESRVYDKIQSQVNTISFQYARNGTIENIVDTPGSKGDDLIELCFRD